MRLSMGFLLVLLMATLWSMIHYCLRVPMYSTAKATFGLAMIAPISILSALGFETLNRNMTSSWGGRLRGGLHILAGTLLILVILAFGS